MAKNNRRIVKGDLSAIIAPPEAMARAAAKEGEKPLWQPFPGFQTECLSSTAFEILLAGVKGSGKALSMDSGVLTIYGWRKMREIQLGDRLPSPLGGTVEVIAIHPQGPKQLWELEFNDGSTVKCCDDHIWYGHWTTRTGKQSGGAPNKTGETRRRCYTTQDIRARFGRSKTNNFIVPLTAPVMQSYGSHTVSDVIDPYTVGVLLGDGSLADGCLKLTCFDPEIVERVQVRYPSTRAQVKEGAFTIPIREYPQLRDWLRNNGLMGKRSFEKYLPEKALKWSIEERFGLLQGLMDTDGYASPNSAIFTSTAKPLAEGVRDLARSLGFKAKLSNQKQKYAVLPSGERKPGLPSWDVTIQGLNLDQVFYLTRKRDACRKDYAGGWQWLGGKKLIAIRDAGVAEAQCITVSSLDGLFLTDGYTVTHNSAVSRAFLIKGNQHRPLYDARGKLIEINASYINHPKYTSLVLRKNQQDLRDWIEHSKEIYEPLGAQYYTNPITIKWPKGGITYTGHLSDENSWGKYLGVEIHRLVIEELVLIEKQEIYEKLRSCVRSSRPGILAQIMCTTNPFGPGVGWIREWWTQTKDGKEIPSGKLHEVVTPDRDTGKEFKTSRIWYFGRWGDNPIQHTDEYKAQMLAGNAEHLIRAYVYGEWDAASGSYLPHFRRNGPLPGEPPEANHIVGPRKVMPYERVVVGADWGSTHEAAASRMKEELEGRIVVEDSFAESGMTTMAFGEMIAALVRDDLKQLDKPVDVFLSPDCWARESEVDSEYKRIMRGVARVVGPERVFAEGEDPIEKSVLDEPGRILIHRANNARIAGWTLLSELMLWKTTERERPDREFSVEEADRVWRTQGEEAWRRYRKAWLAATPRPKPGFMIADTPGNKKLCDALAKMQHGPKGDGDIPKSHWEGADRVDALRYGLLSMSTAPKELDQRMLVRLRLEEMERVKPATIMDFRSNWFFALNAQAMEKKGLIEGGMVDRLHNVGRRGRR